MRRVFNPPSSSSNPVRPVVGALLLTLAVFLVLPLTQMVSSGLRKQLTLTKVDTAQLEPPHPDHEPTPPPPETEEEPEPELPQLSDAPLPMQLVADLDIAVGTGGVLPGFGQFAPAQESAGLLDAFEMVDLEKRPELIVSVPPQYPPELRKARVEGTVILVFVVDENGRVEDPRVESSTHNEFERPALEAVRKWKFRPGQKDGVAVRTYMRLPIRFRVGT